MHLRLVLTIVLTVAGVGLAAGQTAPSKPDRRKAVPAQTLEPSRPTDQKWVEDTIDKFFAIPDDIFKSEPARR